LEGGQPVARPAQHREKRTHDHAASEIRTHDPSFRALDDGTCLRPRDHWVM